MASPLESDKIRARPQLERRSMTASGSFHSTPKKTSSGDKRHPEDGIKKSKLSHPLGFLHTSHHEHRHHLPYMGKRIGDASVSKTSFLHSKAADRNNTAENQYAISREHSQDRLGHDFIEAPTSVRPADSERERRKSQLRDREITNSLNTLSEQASGTTRRLDQALYSIREKVVSLHSTISSLQEVSASSKALHDTFTKDIANVKSEVESQVEAFDRFSGQQHAIEGLECRVQKGKERTDTLSVRLVAARRRVELWDAREKDWQAKTSKRLTWGWVLTLLFVVFIITLVVWKRTSKPLTKLVVNARDIRNETLAKFILDDLTDLRAKRKQTDSNSLQMQSLPTDRRLAIFDQL